MYIPSLEGVKALLCVKSSRGIKSGRVFCKGETYSVINGCYVVSENGSNWRSGDYLSAEFELIMHEATEPKARRILIDLTL